MYGKPRDFNAAGGYHMGPGGMRCPCCAPSPKERDKVKRAKRRREDRQWRKEFAA